MGRGEDQGSRHQRDGGQSPPDAHASAHRNLPHTILQSRFQCADPTPPAQAKTDSSASYGLLSYRYDIRPAPGREGERNDRHHRHVPFAAADDLERNHESVPSDGTEVSAPARAAPQELLD